MDTSSTKVVDGVVVPVTAEDIAQWQIDNAAWVAGQAQRDKDAHNAPILAQLDELDRKSIRALREGDAARVAQIEAQATALRAALVK